MVRTFALGGAAADLTAVALALSETTAGQTVSLVALTTTFILCLAALHSVLRYLAGAEFPAVASLEDPARTGPLAQPRPPSW